MYPCGRRATRRWCDRAAPRPLFGEVERIALFECVADDLARCVHADLLDDHVADVRRARELVPRLGVPDPTAPERLRAVDVHGADTDPDRDLRAAQLVVPEGQDLGVGREAGGPLDPQRLVPPGDHEEQACVRVGHDVGQRVQQVVAAEIRDRQPVLVEGPHEAGRAAAGRDVAVAVGVRGREQAERRAGDESAGLFVDASDLLGLHDRRRVPIEGPEPLERIDGHAELSHVFEATTSGARSPETPDGYPLLSGLRPAGSAPGCKTVALSISQLGLTSAEGSAGGEKIPCATATGPRPQSSGTRMPCSRVSSRARTGSRASCCTRDCRSCGAPPPTSRRSASPSPSTWPRASSRPRKSPMPATTGTTHRISSPGSTRRSKGS